MVDLVTGAKRLGVADTLCPLVHNCPVRPAEGGGLAVRLDEVLPYLWANGLQDVTDVTKHRKVVLDGVVLLGDVVQALPPVGCHRRCGNPWRHGRWPPQPKQQRCSGCASHTCDVEWLPPPLVDVLGEVLMWHLPRGQLAAREVPPHAVAAGAILFWRVRWGCGRGGHAPKRLERHHYGGGSLQNHSLTTLSIDRRDTDASFSLRESGTATRSDGREERHRGLPPAQDRS
mmetsp:Transcript_14735/g.41488  ORF Transcript_14735/g.41488 Transcript_14735/m.41488 type:complete len:230 (-) Transcript_14735:53-742(-)